LHKKETLTKQADRFDLAQWECLGCTLQQIFCLQLPKGHPHDFQSLFGCFGLERSILLAPIAVSVWSSNTCGREHLAVLLWGLGLWCTSFVAHSWNNKACKLKNYLLPPFRMHLSLEEHDEQTKNKTNKTPKGA
jgi:hypothetical protein